MGGHKIVQKNINTVTNFATGEVVNEEVSTVVRFPTEPAYVKMYVSDVCGLVGIANSDQAVLRHLLLRLDYEGYVVLTSRIRGTICKHLEITTKTLSNRLSSLVKIGMIAPVAKNEFIINPNYFARGEWKKICENRENFSLLLSYKASGKKTVKFMKEEV